MRKFLGPIPTVVEGEKQKTGIRGEGGGAFCSPPPSHPE